ncbi:neutral zinc metallopeptidase [Saccharopolyspora sp. CA-218241]|uniref:neutral zinc metallopeptidase n=1 Tax=Saccharopolyspora sp. CA-218241 TaxID=3240027 RepID=UPI003D97B319
MTGPPWQQPPGPGWGGPHGGPDPRFGPPPGPPPPGPPPHLPWGEPPRPPKRGGGPLLALLLVGAVLVTIGAVAIGVALTSGDASNAGATATSSTEPPPTSTTTTTSSSATTSAPPTSRAPGAETAPGPRAVVALGDHPINVAGNGAVNTSCSLPTFSTDVAAQDAFYQAALPCLVEAWTPALEEAGLPVETPTVVTTGTDVETPCGVRGWDETAMYCPGNHTIYMTARYYSEVEGITQAGAYLGQFVHEFGHAVQGMVGIQTAYGQAKQDAGEPTSPAALELTRRSELQATCFEGMTLAALQNGGLSNDYVFPALEDSSNRGDEYNVHRDHGSVATNRAWVEQGFYKNEVTQCNTWLAAASDVD